MQFGKDKKRSDRSRQNVTPNGREIHVSITPDVHPDECEMGDTAQTCLANIV